MFKLSYYSVSESSNLPCVSNCSSFCSLSWNNRNGYVQNDNRRLYKSVAGDSFLIMQWIYNIVLDFILCTFIKT